MRRSEDDKVGWRAYDRWRIASGFALRASDFALRATPGQDDPTSRFRLEAKENIAQSSQRLVLDSIYFARRFKGPEVRIVILFRPTSNSRRLLTLSTILTISTNLTIKTISTILTNQTIKTALFINRFWLPGNGIYSICLP